MKLISEYDGLVFQHHDITKNKGDQHIKKWINQLSMKNVDTIWGQTIFNYNCMYEVIYFSLTHWGRVTNICVSNLNIIGSDNGLSPGRRQAII